MVGARIRIAATFSPKIAIVISSAINFSMNDAIAARERSIRQ